jgi:hypothetical protein
MFIVLSLYLEQLLGRNIGSTHKKSRFGGKAALV